MEKRMDEKEPVLCPVGRFFAELERKGGRKSAFYDHLNRSRIELLKAVRSLVDERIERMEKEDKTEGRRATKIEVE